MAEDDAKNAKAEVSTLTTSMEKVKKEIQQINAEAENIRKVRKANAKSEQELRKLLR